jgi:type VI secretion system secreted protein VgrG
MSNELNRLLDQLGGEFGHFMAGLGGVSHNRYTLTVDGLTTPISVLHVDGDEQLNQPWRYVVTFTSPDKTLLPDAFLNQKSTFFFNPVINKPLTSAIHSLSDLPAVTNKRTLYGVITEFSQLSVNKDEAHYQVVLSSCLARLAVGKNSAIFQNQSVVSVVEEVLRSHGFTGIDYQLALKDNYPEREFITQWQESDLEFIQRLLADVGIWFRFETHAEHDCDVMVLSDYEQGYVQVDNIDYKPPSGMADTGVESVWDITLHSEVVPASVTVQDYNYRNAKADLLTDINTQPKVLTTDGKDYRYAEHYKGLNSNGQDNSQTSNTNNNGVGNHGNPNGNNQYNDNQNDNQIESGQWYARIRHEQAISQQIIIKGKSNRYNLAPGQWININGSPLTNINDGILILSVQGQGNRTDAYALTFTAIPYQALKPYRPAPIRWPQVSGTLPARVTSPDNDTYGYIDTHGRYRVKFNFDLKAWKKGTESLWVRLAKPYSGNTYGFHFPLIDGTEVAIAFMNGNPDRPYIAHAMHDSAHPDHVTTVNKHRNVIRTPANNKLRMDDKRGQEHIKLATEYGKSQLNLGHLVDNKKAQRGEGFELRTDEWGAIRAGKGVYVTTTAQEKAAGQQLEMQDSIKQIEKSLNISYALIECGKSSGAEPAEISQQQALQSATNQLQQPTVVIHGDQGIAQTSSKSIQSSASENIIVTAGKNASVNIFKKLSMAAGEMVSIFAHKLGIKLIAASGRVQIQAQSDELELTAQKNMFITSSGGKVTINAQQELLLLSGGAGIRIKNGTIELIAPTSILQKTALLSYSGAESIKEVTPSFNKGDFSRKFKLHFNGSPSQVLKNHPYRIHFSDGSTQDGITDENGETQMLPMTELEQLKIEILTKD